MTTQDYRTALDAAIREYEQLGEDRRALDKRLADVAQTIGSLSRLLGLTPTVPLGLTDGCRLVLNCKESSGQTVPHLHLHLLGGRDFHWPPG